MLQIGKFLAGIRQALGPAKVRKRIVGTPLERTLVERIGGTLSAASEEGVGSTFTMRLPLDP